MESWLNFYLPLPECGDYINCRETADLDRSVAEWRDLRFQSAGR